MPNTPTTAFDALAAIQSGMRVFVHGGAATPFTLIRALLEHSGRLKNVELIHIHTEGKAAYTYNEYKESFRVSNLFVGANLRNQLDYDRVDYLPCFLSEIPLLFRSGRRPIDVALIHVSPPDPHGYCSLGVSVDIALAAIETAQIVIAQVNSQMPRAHGDGFIHLSKIHSFVIVDEELPETPLHTLTPDEQRIGSYVAELIENGSTIQAGIGTIPEAVLRALHSHRNLGVHTEMWSDGILDLIEAGVIDNSRKKVHPGKTVAGFAFGSRRLYRFIHDNPAVAHLGIDYINSPQIISRNPKVCAINSATQIDLTGQVCADSIGTRIISGVGGQMDFMRGATLSEGGKPILALTSRTAKGFPRILPTLPIGAGVVTSRAHVHFVITEFGIADLFGKTLRERAKALIQIANPLDREELEQQWCLCYRSAH